MSPQGHSLGLHATASISAAFRPGRPRARRPRPPARPLKARAARGRRRWLDRTGQLGGWRRRRVVLGEDPVHELAAAGDADLLEERLDVVADGVRREVQLGGDLGGAEPAGDRPRDLELATGQTVGLDDERRDVGGLRRLDDERHLAGALEDRAVHEQPDAAARAQPRADLRLAVLVRRAHARGEAVRVEGQPQVADVRHQQLGRELVEPLDRLAGRRHHAPCAVEQHDARAAHQRRGAGRLGHHGPAQAAARCSPRRARARSSRRR